MGREEKLLAGSIIPAQVAHDKMLTESRGKQNENQSNYIIASYMANVM